MTSKPAHIVHLTTVHRGDDTRIRAKHCRSAIEAGYRVSLVAPKAEVPLDDGVNHICLPTNRYRSSRATLYAYRAVKKALELKPDIIHFHDPELLGLAWLMKRHCAVIYDVHEDLPRLIMAREWIDKRLRKPVSQLAEFFEPRLARHLNGLVLVDERWHERFGNIDAVQCRNLPMVSMFSKAGDQQQNFPKVPHFVYVGSISKNRGALVATKAVNQLDFDCKLTLAGPVESTSLRDEIMAADAKSRVSLPGVVNREQVSELFLSATCGLNLLKATPAYNNATATKLFEYVSAGLPVIASDTTANKGFAEKTGACLIAKFDQDAAAKCLAEISNDKQLHLQLSKNAHKASGELPSWEDDFKLVLDLYERVLKSL